MFSLNKARADSRLSHSSHPYTYPKAHRHLLTYSLIILLLLLLFQPTRARRRLRRAVLLHGCAGRVRLRLAPDDQVRHPDIHSDINSDKSVGMRQTLRRRGNTLHANTCCYIL